MRSNLLASLILALGLLLGASSSTYADTIAVTSVSLTNLQLVFTSEPSCSHRHKSDR